MILMLWVSAIHTGTLSQYALSQALTDLFTFTPACRCETACPSSWTTAISTSCWPCPFGETIHQ
jgi:hypothetical protein